MVVARDGTWVPLITAMIAGAVTLTTALWARSETRRLKELKALNEVIKDLSDDTENETARGKIIDRRDRLATSIGQPPVSPVFLAAVWLIVAGALGVMVALNLDAWTSTLTAENAVETVAKSFGIAFIIVGAMLMLTLLLELILRWIWGGLRRIWGGLRRIWHKSAGSGAT